MRNVTAEYEIRVGEDGDYEPLDLDEFIRENTDPDVEPLTEDEIAALRDLKIGDEWVYGGGAGEIFFVRRIA